MAEEIRSGDYVTFVRQGGIPVSLVRYGGTYVRVTGSGGKPVTFVQYGGEPISVDDEKRLPEEIRELLGF